MLAKLLGVAFALLALMLVGLTLFLGFHLGGYLWEAHRPAVLSAACIVATALFIRHRRHRHRLQGGDEYQPWIHPGISMHAIPIAGGIGLVFVIGYILMFWFGVPEYRPIVLGAAALGGLVGVTLIWLRGRRSSDRANTSILHLNGHTDESSDQAHELDQGPDSNALQLTSGPWQVRPARS